ncbi:MAG: hypothetical protein UT30_C0002G0001 [Candidatus Uhrbacteria bacterium GW2011_GWF2_39_13]|uniref:Uncharacterized protein n=1 Tax=Candidatus Uhrbacteria bacterium GW2011_GWF2_39_13 TaxID=1618995 RepID=A0A0G0MLJ2_9BACT|nr:MAG: hypothetical protein UT30_C0002G0001 [Candidatus Uhrbacteria bacterium GW2011_GWF2_39_13]
MPSEVVEISWQNPIYTDAEKNGSETDKRKRVLETIKADEEAREAKKEEQLTEKYAVLPDEYKIEFSNAQKDAARVLNATYTRPKRY